MKYKIEIPGQEFFVKAESKLDASVGAIEKVQEDMDITQVCEECGKVLELDEEKNAGLCMPCNDKHQEVMRPKHPDAK